MKVKVELIYDDASKNRTVEVEINDRLSGERFMNAIDKAVERATGKDDPWRRWNLR